MNMGPPDILFTGIPIFIGIVFVLVFGFILFSIVTGIKQWNHNNHQPLLTVFAKVVAKRTNVSHSTHSDANHHAHSSSTTTYFVTFEVESGDRLELQVNGKQYGLIAEGDIGKVSFQGTRYKGFERVVDKEEEPGMSKY